jgi:dihydrofolate reductase
VNAANRRYRVILDAHPGHPREFGSMGGTEASYHSVTSVEEGIARAQELAGEGEIGVGAGEVGGQALSLGLIDQVAIDIVPVVFGRAKPYFGTLDNGHLMLDDPEVVLTRNRPGR